MAFFKLSFYIQAEDLDEAYLLLEEKMKIGAMADTDQEISLEEYEKGAN